MTEFNKAYNDTKKGNYSYATSADEEDEEGLHTRGRGRRRVSRLPPVIKTEQNPLLGHATLAADHQT
jgi:hypothetical protein